MGDLTRPQLAAYAVAVAVIALIGARYLHVSGGGTAGDGTRPVPVRVDHASSAGGWAVVQVAGEVRRPGVYRVRSGERVDDAVHLAGGATARADLAGVNLAAKVEDGRQVIVPARGAGASGPSAPAGGPAGAAGGTGAPLNLNTASVEQLDQLDGVGPATARKIVAYRQQKGGFRSVAELDQVPGIGPKRLASLKDRLRV